jgi:hypothetical protein
LVYLTFGLELLTADCMADCLFGFADCGVNGAWTARLGCGTPKRQQALSLFPLPLYGASSQRPR